MREKRQVGPLFDYLPIVAFFVTLKLSDIYIATAVAVVVTIAVLAYQRIKKGHVETMTVVSAAIMVVFGGLTIALHDKEFIQWKPTVLYLVVAAVFFGSRFIGEKPAAQRMLAKVFEAERKVWLRVNDGLALVFVALAILNRWAAAVFDDEGWATFKLFGTLGIMFVAFIVATLYLSKRGKRIEPATEPEA